MLKLIKIKYLLKYHEFYYQRITILKEQVRVLRSKLELAEFKQHETVKLAARIHRADQEIIPENPDRPEYRLKREIKNIAGINKACNATDYSFVLPADRQLSFFCT